MESKKSNHSSDWAVKSVRPESLDDFRVLKNGSDRPEAYPFLRAWWLSAVWWQKSSACNGQASRPACNQFIWNRGLLSSRYI